MPTTPAQTSGTSSSGTQAPSRWPSIGLVDRPPPTHRSKPGPCSGCTTPTKAMSLISCATSCRGEPEIAVLNLRGRLENSGLPMYRSRISSMAGVPSMISSSAMPATGEPRMTRGVSPQASVVDRPTASTACQISGTSSMRIQCNWMFCRSVRSAVPRANRGDLADDPQRSVVSRPPSMRTRSMKYLSSSSSGSRTAVLPPSMPGRAGCTGPTSASGRAGRSGRSSRSPV